jgi:hypothetical protein
MARIDYDILRLTRLAERRDVLAAKGFLPQQTKDETHDELNHNQRLRPLQAETNRRQEELRIKQLPQIHAGTKGHDVYGRDPQVVIGLERALGKSTLQLVIVLKVSLSG